MAKVIKFARFNCKFGGLNGYLPAIFTQRTAESDAWTLHRSVSLHTSHNVDSKSESDSTDVEMSVSYPHEESPQLAKEKSEECFQEWKRYWQTVDILNKSDGISNILSGTGIDWKAHVHTMSDKEKDVVTKNGTSDKRWVFTLRHGERVDLTYGDWVQHCTDKNGEYVRKDLNLPLQLAERVGGMEAYSKDSPLTRVGQLQAHLVGEGLRLAGITVTHVYASAALRCVQTAHEFLKGLQADPSVKIRVEPGLFEYKMWHFAKGMADFMTPEEFHKAGYNVDLSYKPLVNLDLKVPETLDDYYDRNEKVMHTAVKETEEQGDNIIFVGHANTLDQTTIALKRLNVELPERPPYMISGHLNRVPYCALGAMKGKPWEVVAPPCPPSINTSSGRFDWKLLLTL